MKEVICYKLDDGSIYEDKEKAIRAEEVLQNKNILNHTQQVPLRFKVGDIVYISCRNKIRQCKVVFIREESAYYDEETKELYTVVDLEDINDKEESLISYWTSQLKRDLNTEIKTTIKELCNFDYEKYL